MKVGINKNPIVMEVLGTYMGPISLMHLGRRYGIISDDAYLQVTRICEDAGIHQCHTCHKWGEERDFHNDVCNSCYCLDHDE